MRYSKEQIDRSLKKLARAVADWNHLDHGESKEDRARKTTDLFNAAWRLIHKTGNYPAYKKQMDKYYLPWVIEE